MNNSRVSIIYKMDDLDDLVEELVAASAAYHNDGTLLMSDTEYDAAVETLRKTYPTHPFLFAIGAPVTAGDEVSLPVPLPSLNKISVGDSSFYKWTARFKETKSYHISAKLDGCSALWIPATRKLYTRGDGMLGRDISAFVKYFKGFPETTAKHPQMIRGELIMRTDSPAIPAGKLARNIVAGVLNRKAHETDPELFSQIRFVAYEIVTPTNMRPSVAFELLRMRGYETAECVNVAEVTPAALSELFSKMESNSVYRLDGIVVAPDIARNATWTPEIRNNMAVNPTDRVAWKTRQITTTQTTTVTSVEWNISASGVLIPRVLFNPVKLAGARISAATGVHGRWIADNVIGPGAIVEVLRAGDVIPQIIAVHVAADAGAAMPPEGSYMWDGVNIKPTAKEPSDSLECVRITHALKELGVENVGPGIVEKLYAAGFKTVGAIYAASPAQLSECVEGVKERAAERIWQGLRVKQTEWTELDLMLASCTMPRGVGRSKLQGLLTKYPVPSTWSTSIIPPEGLSAATVESIVAAIPAYLAWREANITTTVVSKPVLATPAAAQLTVVFTGFRNTALESQLIAAGHVIANNVTMKTSVVVYPDGPKPMTGKVMTAENYGCKVMPVSEFKLFVTTLNMNPL